jgi:hypothetical protein
MANTGADQAARALHSVACQCLEALTLLLDVDPEVGSAPIGMLAGHAIEAGLKSYLTLKGATEKDLRRIGHDLEAAWLEARARGLDILPATPTWLRGVNFSFENLRYRYRGGGWLPRRDVFLETIEDLVDTVGRALPPLAPPEPF